MSAKKQNTSISKQNSAASVKKRDQIASSSRTMFLWVSGASVVVAFALVLSIFLIKKIVFNERVLAEKGKTSSVLQIDIKNVKDLHHSVDELRADDNLTALRSSGTTNNLDVILDALPYEGDPVGFGSSLQTTLLSGISIQSLTVDPIIQADSSSGASTSASVDTTNLTPIDNAQPITFTFKVEGSENDLRNLFKKLNSSIRPIKIITTQFQSGGSGKIQVTIQALTYYQPKKTFSLQQKVVKP